MQSMVMKMKTKFDKYWGECNLLLSIAAVLDPRNKMKLIEFCFPMIYPEPKTSLHIDTIRRKLIELYSSYVTSHSVESGLNDGKSDRLDFASCGINNSSASDCGM